MPFNAAQVKQLLAPINPRRVLKDGKNNSHIAAHDVLAHLNRVFGFGNFSIEVMSTELVHQSCRNPDANYREQRWDVVYRAQVRVSIFEQDGEMRIGTCFYENVSCGDAQNQVLHDAHDLALKSAVSLATKRACIALGDQFGLSLYNKGQMTALVRGTKVLPSDWEDETDDKDVQEGVEQTVALGTDETVHNDHLSTEGSDEVTPEQKEMLEHSLGATEVKTEEVKA